MRTTAFKQTTKRTIALAVATALVGTSPAMAESGDGPDPELWFSPVSSKVAGTDDWSAADLNLPPGLIAQFISCSEGDLDLAGRFPCDPGTRLEIRDLGVASELYADDPRLTGVGEFTFSASFAFDGLDLLSGDRFFVGPAWGSWRLESVCGGEWRGTFNGARRFVPGQSQAVPGVPGVWISDLTLRGTGHGGCVDGLRLRGTEHITTLTPLPLPYENFLPVELCDSGLCGPEGTLSGHIFRRWRSWGDEAPDDRLD